MSHRVGQAQLRNRFQLWRIATSRQYNIRVPRHLTMHICGTKDLLPMPPIWIRRLLACGSSSAASGGLQRQHTSPAKLAQSTAQSLQPGGARLWHVLYNLGNGTATKVVPVESRVSTAAAEQHDHRPQAAGARKAVVKQLSGVNTQLYLMLAHMTQQRELFHAYRVWRRFAEIARALRELQARQVRVIHAMESTAMSVVSTQRVLFGSWKQWARRRRHHKDIMSVSGAT